MSPRTRGWRRRPPIVVATLLALVAVGDGALAVSSGRSQLARAVIWGESDVGDSAHSSPAGSRRGRPNPGSTARRAARPVR